MRRQWRENDDASASGLSTDLKTGLAFLHPAAAGPFRLRRRATICAARAGPFRWSAPASALLGALVYWLAASVGLAPLPRRRPCRRGDDPPHRLPARGWPCRHGRRLRRGRKPVERKLDIMRDSHIGDLWRLGSRALADAARGSDREPRRAWRWSRAALIAAHAGSRAAHAGLHAARAARARADGLSARCRTCRR